VVVLCSWVCVYSYSVGVVTLYICVVVEFCNVELWSCGVVESWSCICVESWSCGVVELWSCVVVELWHCGVV